MVHIPPEAIGINELLMINFPRYLNNKRVPQNSSEVALLVHSFLYEIQKKKSVASCRGSWQYPSTQRLQQDVYYFKTNWGYTVIS